MVEGPSPQPSVKARTSDDQEHRHEAVPADHRAGIREAALEGVSDGFDHLRRACSELDLSL
jgi:hypothetical protein